MKVSSSLSGLGRSLKGFRKASVQKFDGYQLVVGGPVPPQADAITIGKTVFVRKHAARSDRLIAHELIHVHQFERMGRFKFFRSYVGSYLKLRLSGYGHMAAYRRIPLEVEAVWLSRLAGRDEIHSSLCSVVDRDSYAAAASLEATPKTPTQNWRLPTFRIAGVSARTRRQSSAE